MRNSSFAGTSLGGLFRELANNLKTLLREQRELAKNETLEKISYYGHNGISLAVGGLAAFLGLIVLLGGLGFLLGFGLGKVGLNPVLAIFVGWGLVGLLVIALGGVMILKSLKAFSAETPKPEKTIEAIKRLKGTREVAGPQPREEAKAPRRSSEEVQGEVLATEERINEELEEIAYRTSPAGVKKQAEERIKAHPYAWSLVALASGTIGSFFLGRKFRRA